MGWEKVTTVQQEMGWARDNSRSRHHSLPLLHGTLPILQSRGLAARTETTGMQMLRRGRVCTSPFCLQHKCLEERGIPCCPLSLLCAGPAILAWHRVLCTEADGHFATKNRSKGGMSLDGMCRQSPGPRNASEERSTLSVLFPPLVLSKGDIRSDVILEEENGQYKPPLSPCCFSDLCK